MANRVGYWRASRAAGLFLRELIGWGLLLFSLNIFRTCFMYLNQTLVIEGAVVAIVGVMLFRGGLQLIKVSVAARALRPPLPTDLSGDQRAMQT